ncbi:MAG: S53 family peptidase [Terracidiphilus sp.]
MNGKRSPRSLYGPATLIGAVAFMMFTFSCLAQQSVQMLQGHVPAAVSNGQAALIGSLPTTQKLHVTISLPLRNQDALGILLKQLYDPTSPYYHHFLSVAEFAEQFAPTADDYQSVVNFATANGLTVTDQPKDRLIVPLDGTVLQIESAFNVRMNVYQHPTENRTFYSPDREPSLVLAVPVAHITGLDNFYLPRPAFEKASENGKAPVPAAGSGPGGQYLASDMRAAYYGGTSLTGSGQTVGLVEFDGYNLSDVDLSLSSVGQSYGVPVQNVLLDGATGAACQFLSPCDDAEQVLDVVQAIGMAPGLSQVRVYIGSSDVDILNAIYQENIAKQVSISWVWGPNYSGDGYIFSGMAATGQTVFAASGDWGSYPAIHPAYPAEDPNVTAVGGTHLNTNGAGGPWQAPETAWSDSGGGPSPDGISIPTYQSSLYGSNGASTTLRNVPDVAAEADYDNYYCDLGTCSGGAAGTSFATPRWAGFMALVNQQAVEIGSSTTGMGLINSALYRNGEEATCAGDFHDVTSGSNGGYSAGIGYDLVTGWGSPNGQGMIDVLSGGPVTPPVSYSPTSDMCVNEPLFGATVTNPSGPETQNGGDAELLTDWEPHKYMYAQCTWSGFSNITTTAPMALSIPISYVQGAGSSATLSVNGLAGGNFDYTRTCYGTEMIPVPVGTNLSTLSVTGEAIATGGVGNDSMLEVGWIYVH